MTNPWTKLLLLVYSLVFKMGWGGRTGIEKNKKKKKPSKFVIRKIIDHSKTFDTFKKKKKKEITITNDYYTCSFLKEFVRLFIEGPKAHRSNKSPIPIKIQEYLVNPHEGIYTMKYSR